MSLYERFSKIKSLGEVSSTDFADISGNENVSGRRITLMENLLCGIKEMLAAFMQKLRAQNYR